MCIKLTAKAQDGTRCTCELDRELSFSSFNVAAAIFMQVQHEGVMSQDLFCIFCHIWMLNDPIFKLLRLRRAEFIDERTRRSFFYEFHL